MPRRYSPTPRPGTCDALHVRASTGDRYALGAARRLRCDWAPPPGSIFQRGANSCTSLEARHAESTGRKRVNALAKALEKGCDWAIPRTPATPPAPVPAPCSPEDPACPATDRRSTEILTPQGADRAHYAIFNAPDLAASHDPFSFAPDPRYPSGVQEREYDTDKNEQGKVERGARKLNPALLLHRSPTAVDGPPLVTEDGCALGGNGRTIMLKRAYGEHPEKAAAYKAALACAARDFGLSPAEIRATPQPVLVRVVEGTTCESSPSELARAVRRFNEGLTQSLDARAMGVAKSRQISPSTIALFGQLVSGDTSLRTALRANPRPVIAALEADGVITRENKSTWVADGNLTDEARDQIESMFLGRVLGDARRIRATDPSVLAKIEKAVPYLTAVAGRNPAFDLTREVQAGVDLANRAAAQSASVEQVLQTGDMFSAPPSRPAADLARMLTTLGPNTIRDRFKAWSARASFDPGQGLIGSRPPTFDEAFAELTDAPRLDRALFRGTVLQGGKLGSGMARIDQVGARGQDVPVGSARITWITGPSKGLTATVSTGDLGDVVS